jgi:hypothetical protein
VEIEQNDRYRLESDNFSRAIDALYRSAERGGVPRPL